MEQQLHEAIISLRRDDRLPEDSHQTMATVLIPIEDHLVGNERVPTVSARALYAWLGSRQEFSHWIEARIAQFGFVQGIDFTPANVGEPESQSFHRLPMDTDYRLTLDMAKELSMVECNEKGRQARQYLIAGERRLKANIPDPEVLQVLSDPNQLRTLLLDFTERVIAMQAKAAKDAPKVAFHDALVGAANTQSIQEVAKVLGVGAVKFFEWLRRAGLLMHNNLPYQCHIEAGYFKVVQRSFINRNDEKQMYARTLVTGKGLAYLQRRYQMAHQNTTVA
ncbi:MAG: phage antirepressor KilAC domain-containing protein [Proteobacteria bacterium]|nr:phage antirepressor KilAC domain-containing protein [Pseudomonadota bacterium]